VFDADLIAMQSALARFARKADAADLALIYFSGHGIEIDDRNYLIPVSARLVDASDADFETVPLDQALLAADRAGKVKIVVLDACRSNPFRARMVRSQKQGRRSVGRGLAAVAEANGMRVAYAARAGSEAGDGPKDGNSPFTAAFLKFVESPRMDVRIMLGRVRDEVVRATGRQEPFTYGSLGGEEVFLNAAAAALADPAAGQPAEAVRVCREVEGISNLSMLRVLAGQHKGTAAGDCIAARIDEVKKQELLNGVPAAAVKPELAPSKVAEGVVAGFNASRAPTPLTAPEERALTPGNTFKECRDCPESGAGAYRPAALSPTPPNWAQ
jgi:uncharacterized caspase-like protein